MEKFRFRITAYNAVSILRYLSIIVVFSLIGLLGCSSMPVEKEVTMERTSFSFAQDEHPYDLFPVYRIVPGDILDVLYQIRTWLKKEDFKIAIDHTIHVKFIYAPELNEEQKARPDGNITLPYIGDVYVVGKTIDELTQELKNRYSKILNIPELFVEVPEFRTSIKELKADLHTAPRGLSRLVTVRPDGFVTFPMVGDVFVAGKTVPEVNKVLNDMYEKMLPDLHCDLFLERHAGSSIYVVGQVKKPGAYQISRPVTILEALSLAEGHIPGAKLDTVFIIRKHEKAMVATRINLEKTLAFSSDSKFFFLQPNDIVYVPQTWISSASEVARDIGNIIFFRGWGFGFTWELHNAGSGGNNSGLGF
jgi:polysaccharide export outer membrane protein